MTPDEQTRAAGALIDQLAPVVKGVPHDVVLHALLAMYRTTALTHACCTETAAEACAQVALNLVRAVHTQPPTGAKLH